MLLQSLHSKFVKSTSRGASLSSIIVDVNEYSPLPLGPSDNITPPIVDCTKLCGFHEPA